ncbi:hypothetical protein RUND412_008279 [Rhizina undulata]
MSPPKPTSITLADFNAILSRYESTITALSAAQTARSKSKPKNSKALSDLDDWRRGALVQAIASRVTIKNDDKKAYMQKGEVEDLVYCKLKRGKFRPTLPSLVASNTEASIKSATTTAFAKLSSSPTPLKAEAILESLGIISTLRGIGPATASYILAAHSPARIPVFSDEGYRWVFFEEGAGKGLKYDEKEYAGYLTRVWDIVERLKNENGSDVTAEDVEKVGFVLGKDVELGSDVGKVGTDEKKAVEKKAPKTTAKKRKQEDDETLEEVDRKRSRKSAEEGSLRRSQRNRRN